MVKLHQWLQIQQFWVPLSRCGHLQNEELATPWLKLHWSIEFIPFSLIIEPLRIISNGFKWLKSSYLYVETFRRDLNVQHPSTFKSLVRGYYLHSWPSDSRPSVWDCDPLPLTCSLAGIGNRATGGLGLTSRYHHIISIIINNSWL